MRRPGSSVPTPEQTGLPRNVLKEVNEAVTKVMEREQRPKKRKRTTTYTPGDRAAIGRCAAENGNSAAVKKFRHSHDVGES